jgi:hypothetical protein
MAFKIRRFRYEMPVGSLDSADTNTARTELAKNIADEIYLFITLAGVPTYSVNHRPFDQVANLHTDVWIDNPSRHALLYTNNVYGPDLPAPPIGAIPATVSKVRGFSGDVSGVIGETAFAWIMREHYDMDERNIVHLRPVKKIGGRSTGRYPDFEIHNPSAQFHDEIPLTINRTHLYPFPVEAKGVTNPQRSQIRERLDRAIEQLQSYWTFQKWYTGRDNLAGLISIAMRNTDFNTYDIFFVWCQ